MAQRVAIMDVYLKSNNTPGTRGWSRLCDCAGHKKEENMHKKLFFCKQIKIAISSSHTNKGINDLSDAYEGKTLRNTLSPKYISLQVQELSAALMLMPKCML